MECHATVEENEGRENEYVCIVCVCVCVCVYIKSMFHSSVCSEDLEAMTRCSSSKHTSTQVFVSKYDLKKKKRGTRDSWGEVDDSTAFR